MQLAHHIKSADAEELNALAEFLLVQFDVFEKSASQDGLTPAALLNVQKAIGAWAYMQTNSADQGD